MLENRELEADFTVVGAGGAGLSAALTAATEGMRVILLEKLAGVGGCTTFAEGMFAAESRLQLQKNIIIDKDGVFKHHMEACNWRSDPRLVRAFIDKSANTIDWLQSLGVEFIDVMALYPGGPMTWHTIKGFGAAMVKILLKVSKANGVRILNKTAAKKLILEAGRVVGVIAEDNSGNIISIKSKAVLIADGGFANNRELLEKYTNAGPNLIPMGNEGKTGDGMLMAWEAGAAASGTDVLQLVTPVVKTERGISHLAAAMCQPNLWINELGERFCDEALFRFPLIGNAQANQKNQIIFHIFDETLKNYMRDTGVDFGMGMYVPAKMRLSSIDSDIERCVKDGEAFVADNIDGLAVKIGIKPVTLMDTVNEYNTFCDKRHDSLFAKKHNYLRPIRTPKFYALRGFPCFTGTLGGIKINHKTEVLNKNFDVIAGLYAAGNCAGGMYGDSYDSSSAGTALAFAVNSGRIAGESVIEHIKKG